ncbi:MAG: hypothetical protein JXX28_01890 [Deltaproteobacteria bacterium]|nr:hypothetical protein [Deltaproteobacteria bacterium]
MSDLFAPLDAVLSRFRSDVHRLGPPAPPAALTTLEGHLQRALPPGLRAFLGRYNGAALFRGALRLRSTSEMSPAQAESPEVVLFADQPEDGRRWAWAADGQGGFVFGVWADGALVPYHASFGAWLAGSLAVQEAKARSERDRMDLRLEASPDDPYQQLLAGEAALMRGQIDEAERWIHSALSLAPHLVAGWQILGDALVLRDRPAARRAWMEAFRRSRLPSPWTGAPLVAPETLHALGRGQGNPETWERDLARFLAEAHDVKSARELGLVVAVARELAAAQVRRGRRAEALQTLDDLLGRCATFTYAQTPWVAGLEQARLNVELGHHDNAEHWLRLLRREGPKELQGEGHLLLARIAVLRQEPWVHEILDDALRAGLDERGRLEALLLRVEVGLRATPLPAQLPEWLAGAAKLTPRVGHPRYHAALALAEGEVARATGDGHLALKRWEEGLVHLSQSDDPEMRGRLELRLGDLYRDADQAARALEHYQIAARIFREHGYPTREAWALLRLAPYVHAPEELLQEALERFQGADLPAGVAAVDALSNRNGAHLHWILERGTAQTRARRDAQEARNDLTREDADRPERRLGALRLAVAMGGRGVVETIGAELDTALAAFQGGRMGPRDPTVHKYIASVDLLAGHHSYPAARKLLEHLFSDRLQGIPLDALKGAIARSPNAALVDGLLQAVEDAERFPPQTVAIACEILGLRKEDVAFAPLTHLVSPSAPPSARKAGIIALGRLGRREARDYLVPALTVPQLAEVASLALLMLGDTRGLPFHAEALHRRRTDLGTVPGEILGRYGGPAHLPLLLEVARSSHVLSLGAIQGMALLGHPRAIPQLVEILQTVTDPQRREVLNLALRVLTGHEEDLAVPGLKRRWAAWWEANSGRFADGVRVRMGEVFSAGALIDSLDSASLWIRHNAYDELVITTGSRLPFDYDGPWRLQRAHLEAWRDWWRSHRTQHPPGTWSLDGRPVG